MIKHVLFLQVPAIYEKHIKDGSGRWSSIAKKHAKLLLKPSPDELKAKAKRSERKLGYSLEYSTGHFQPYC